jgi:hypothetical protein
MDRKSLEVILYIFGIVMLSNSEVKELKNKRKDDELVTLGHQNLVFQ